MHGRGLDIRLGDRRVFAGLDQLVQMLHELAHVVVAQRPGGGLHPIEELRDVLALDDVARRLLAIHPAEPAGISEEQIEQLARRHLAPQLHVPFEILDEVPDRRMAGLVDLVAELADRVGLPKDVEQVDVPAIGVGRAAGEIDDGHLIQLRGRQVVETHRLVGMNQGAQEGDQEPNLRPAVES